MPCSEAMDLSKADENERKRVVEGHVKLLKFLKILEPEVILFHPSYYLDHPGQREIRKNQLIKSVKESNVEVSEMGAQIVDRKSTRLNSSHMAISYAVFCLT